MATWKIDGSWWDAETLFITSLEKNERYFARLWIVSGLRFFFLSLEERKFRFSAPSLFSLCKFAASERSMHGDLGLFLKLFFFTIRTFSFFWDFLKSRSTMIWLCFLRCFQINLRILLLFKHLKKKEKLKNLRSTICNLNSVSGYFQEFKL